MTTSSKAVRTVIETIVPPGVTEEAAVEKIVSQVGAVYPARAISSTSRDPNSPDPALIAEDLSQYLLALFPNFCSDMEQNAFVAKVLARTLGSTLVLPLRSSPEGTSLGAEAIDNIVGEIRRIAYDGAVRVSGYDKLNELQPTDRPN